MSFLYADVFENCSVHLSWRVYSSFLVHQLLALVNKLTINLGKAMIFFFFFDIDT